MEELKNVPDWLELFVMLSYTTGPNVIEAIDRQFDQDRKAREYVDNCPNMELEEDMGRHIPYCSITNEPCDLHCRGPSNGSLNCLCNNRDRSRIGCWQIL